MEKKTIELLAPAGSWEALEAAVNAGADAVYMGGKAFGARAYASNFDEEEMAKAVYFAHMHHVRLYITVNTLVDDSELEALSAYLLFLNNVGVDGLIVQDLGVIRLAKKIVPELPLHASTQMSITNSSGVDFAMGAGMERSVLARELSLKEIGAACSRGSEIETFIHGALCVCYSGQCLMSSLIGGRSGNRGRCAQPCRLPYKLLNAKDEDMLQGKDAGQYLLSPKDMNTLSILPQLIDAGVVSYKIEGRMKRPEYVAAAVSQFKQALEGQQADMDLMAAVFSRSGFTQGYFDGKLGQEMFGTRQKEDVLAGQKVLKSLNDLASKDVSRVGVDFVFSMCKDQPVTLCAQDQEGHQVQVSGPLPQEALKAPTTEELVHRSLEKMGGTFYMLDGLRCQLDDGLICPASQLNALRRQALEQLTEQRGEIVAKPFYRLEPQKVQKHQPKRQPDGSLPLRAYLRQLSQLTEELVESCELLILPLAELLRGANRLDKKVLEKIAVSLPRVVFGDDLLQLVPKLEECLRLGVRHLSTGNLGGVRLGRELGFIVHGEFGLNIANAGCLQAYEQLGLRDCLLSFELSMARAKGIGGNLPRGLLVYGKLPLMITRNCPIRLGGCKDCRGVGTLTDRKKETFEVRCTERAYSEIFNAKPVYLADRMEELDSFDYGLLYFTGEGPKQVDRILKQYTQLHQPMQEITRGLYYRNVK